MHIPRHGSKTKRLWANENTFFGNCTQDLCESSWNTIVSISKNQVLIGKKQLKSIAGPPNSSWNTPVSKTRKTRSDWKKQWNVTLNFPNLYIFRRQPKIEIQPYFSSWSRHDYMSTRNMKYQFLCGWFQPQKTMLFASCHLCKRHRCRQEPQHPSNPQTPRQSESSKTTGVTNQVVS